ncbi:MAG: ABC-F family ATP-binding cassette domain-containing protein [Oscillospiraceae bacterium]|nr:ABC-F family ATP-binding cassette domain-containing protein [Oscillospiraceae bacterium]
MLANLININKFYNGKQILKNVSLTIDEKDRIGLIGVNGCGKTTLLRILTGKELPDRSTEKDGIVSFASKASVGYLEQMAGLDRDSTVIDEMKSVFKKLDATLERMKQLEQQMKNDADVSEEVSEEYSRLATFYEANDGYTTDVKIKTVLNGMGFTEKEYDRTIHGFSGGEKTRLAIAKLLLEEPNLLILDEPTNHLDFKTILWLEDYLKDYKGALLIVSHDRYFLDRIVTSVCEIERGMLTRYKGNYTAFTRLKKESVNRQQKEYEAQQKEIAKMEDFIARNKVRASTANSAKSREKALERMEIIEKPVSVSNNANIHFEYTVTPPFDILSVKDIDITVGSGAGKKTLAEHISFEVKRGEKLGIIGDNGIGKSTLLKIIQGMLPHSGKIRWASNVRISYFEQESANLDPFNTVIDELHRHYPILTDLDIRSLLGSVGITGENVFKETGVISGGERAKVCFALMMLEKGNVLILDEPTNHLDLDAKEAIEQALDEFDGTVIFVSHDRYLLNKIAGRLLEIRTDGTEMYEGGFDYYLEVNRKRRMEEQQRIDAEKTQKAAEIAAEKSVKAYKSKEQRTLEAKRRNRIRELENAIEDIQQQLDVLQEEITKEEVYSDFELMNSKCSLIDELKQKSDEMFDEIVELSD